MYKDMTIIHGILECPLLNLGSKSEGRRAILTDDEGKKYKLYRPGYYPPVTRFLSLTMECISEFPGTQRKKQGVF